MKKVILSTLITAQAPLGGDQLNRLLSRELVQLDTQGTTKDIIVSFAISVIINL